MAETEILAREHKAEKGRADAWEKWARDLARELGINDEDSNGSIHDAKTIRYFALKGKKVEI